LRKFKSIQTSFFKCERGNLFSDAQAAPAWWPAATPTMQKFFNSILFQKPILKKKTLLAAAAFQRLVYRNDHAAV
jgi:hypothetical protein